MLHARKASGRGKGLVIAMHYSRQQVVDVLARCGFSQLADEALRVLPDPIDSDQLDEWGVKYGLTINDLISQRGGSP
jgi:hypothetical protein